jgi:hypothetical protein
MAFDTTTSKFDSAFAQRDRTNSFYEQVNISGSDLIIYHDETGSLTADNINVWATKYGIGSGTNVSASWASSSISSSIVPFNGNRQIKRSGYLGLNVGGEDVDAFLENFFFPFVTSTVSIVSGAPYYETGSSQNITVNGAIIRNDETSFGTGSVYKDGGMWNTIPSIPGYTYSFVDTGVTSNHSYHTVIQTLDNGNVNSSISTVSFLYPYLYGMSATDGLSGTALYSAMIDTVVPRGTRTISMIGNGVYIYFCYPASYPALTSILDQNGIQSIGNFNVSTVSVTSAGLTNNWTNTYQVYQSKLLANPAGNYTFT